MSTTVDERDTYDIQTQARGKDYVVVFNENPRFDNRETVQQVASEINEVLQRSGEGQ